MKPALHSTGAASRMAALHLPQIFPILSVVAPCQPGASPVSVRRASFTADCDSHDYRVMVMVTFSYVNKDPSLATARST